MSSSESSKYCIGLLDVKPSFEPKARHHNSRYLAKILRVNKIAVKSFSKNLSYGFHFNTQRECYEKLGQ